MTRTNSETTNEGFAAEGRRLVDVLGRHDVTARLLGGTAVFEHCPSARDPGWNRDIGDVDLVVGSSAARKLATVMTDEGYRPESRFNSLHGSSRLIFNGEIGRIDVVVGTFEMCHRLDLTARLGLDSPTIPVTDLLVTKLQIVELNEKDMADCIALLQDHDTGSEEGDILNTAYLGLLVADNWGLWRTMHGTLARLHETTDDVALLGKIETLDQAISEYPKSWRFQARGRLGEKKRWYTLPDEVEQ